MLVIQSFAIDTRRIFINELASSVFPTSTLNLSTELHPRLEVDLDMTVICLGPCCIPVAALFPFLIFLISPILNLLRKTPLGGAQPSLKLSLYQMNSSS